LRLYSSKKERGKANKQKNPKYFPGLLSLAFHYHH